MYFCSEVRAFHDGYHNTLVALVRLDRAWVGTRICPHTTVVLAVGVSPRWRRLRKTAEMLKEEVAFVWGWWRWWQCNVGPYPGALVSLLCCGEAQMLGFCLSQPCSEHGYLIFTLQVTQGASDRLDKKRGGVWTALIRNKTIFCVGFFPSGTFLCCFQERRLYVRTGKWHRMINRMMDAKDHLS